MKVSLVSLRGMGVLNDNSFTYFLAEVNKKEVLVLECFTLE